MSLVYDMLHTCIAVRAMPVKARPYLAHVSCSSMQDHTGENPLVGQFKAQSPFKKKKKKYRRKGEVYSAVR